MRVAWLESAGIEFEFASFVAIRLRWRRLQELAWTGYATQYVTIPYGREAIRIPAPHGSLWISFAFRTGLARSNIISTNE